MRTASLVTMLTENTGLSRCAKKKKSKQKTKQTTSSSYKFPIFFFFFFTKQQQPSSHLFRLVVVWRWTTFAEGGGGGPLEMRLLLWDGGYFAVSLEFCIVGSIGAEVGKFPPHFQVLAGGRQLLHPLLEEHIQDMMAEDEWWSHSRKKKKSLILTLAQSVCVCESLQGLVKSSSDFTNSKHKWSTKTLIFFYLGEGTGSLPDHPNDSERDADHWRHGHEPADPVAPVGVGVLVVVLERFVFNQEEEENTLQRTKGDVRASAAAEKNIFF